MKLYYKLKYWYLDTYDTTKHLVRNLYVFRKTLLTHRWYSYEGVYTALEDALKDMCKEQGDKDRKVKTHLYVAQMEEAIGALERLSKEYDDFYYERYKQCLQDKKIVANMFEHQLEDFWD